MPDRAPSWGLSEGRVEAAAEAIAEGHGYGHIESIVSSYRGDARRALRAAGLPEMEAALREVVEGLEIIRDMHAPIDVEPNFCERCTTSWPCATYNQAVSALAAGAEAALCDKEGGGDG